MSMTKEEVLAKYFSEKKGFRDVQEETIDSLLAGKNTLCLMPTGGGKSLIYQVAGLCMEKTTIIISPLIALMNQQNAEMRAMGISTVSFSGMDYKKQFALITDMANGVMPQYIFTSPERISSDGFIYILILIIKRPRRRMLAIYSMRENKDFFSPMLFNNAL